MVGIFRCVLFLAVAVCTTLLVSTEVSGTDTPWIGAPIYKVSSEVHKGPLAPGGRCSAVRTVISVKDKGLVRDACVFGRGEGTRLARYRSDSGVVYAVAFTAEEVFTSIRGLCENVSECVYSQSEDVLLLQTRISTLWYGHALVKDFTKTLQRVEGGQGYYRFNLPDGVPYIATPSRIFATGASAVSSNGRWAIVEIHSFGFVRVDMKTLSFRRVVAPGALYGVANDPTFEVTIADDGRHIAITGLLASIGVYQLTDTCGDILGDDSSFGFFYNATGCSQATVERYQLFPGFVSAHEPRFVAGVRGLSVIVSKLNGTERAVISPDASFNATPGRYYAYGDSFTSGEGETEDRFYAPETNAPTNTCHVSSRAYPYLLGIRWGVTTTNNACSGARIRDVVSAIGAATSQSPSVISIGIGGNDANLIGKLKTCLGIGTCEWASADKRIATAHEIKALLPKVIEMIDYAKSRFTGLPLLIIGYPSVVNSEANARCDVLISTLLDSAERRFLSEAISYLNIVLREAAHYTGARFVDTDNAFVNERLCDDKALAMNSIRYGGDIAPFETIPKLKIIGSESFHPTPRGHQLIANKITEILGESWGGPACTCAFSVGAMEPSEYWQSQAEAKWIQVEQKRGDFLSSAVLAPSSLVQFTFPPGTFKPGGDVKLELHSERHPLGMYTPDANGALRGSFEAPLGVYGYHTIHANGSSTLGQPLDLYEIVFIESQLSSTPLIEYVSDERLHQAAALNGPTITTNFSEGKGLVAGSVTTHAQSHSPQKPPLFIWAYISFALLTTVMGVVYLFVRKKKSSVSRRGG